MDAPEDLFSKPKAITFALVFCINLYAIVEVIPQSVYEASITIPFFDLFKASISF